ncbi:DEAD/DEAH box helicase [Haematospirillum sp. 15-248]|uniref:DEAD/DEAH box helicase n=1 Tax=Haematospirillum sp. 15-248 TaxID=2723107 RepID=UPI0014392130|nr:DEAD/DEAH box helicase [Haematospirillum sp. 15-248]NKD86879.1 DEAD/DEAH box helicase [Haematospirillum sp. 15-248]
MNFADLGLSPETLQAVTEVGYSTPTPIQEQAIPWVLMGRDVMGIAQTGTGKTASFTLPMIDILANGRAKARMPRSLILAPTRELANQVAENFTLYGKYHNLSMALLIGGESFTEQEKLLDRGVDVLVATPGRLIDLFERGRIILRDVKILVIDEADRMLDMGFIPDVERIVSLLPPLRQTLFFSATMDDQIRRLTNVFLNNPKEVKVARQATAAETVLQKMLVVQSGAKRETLRRILQVEDVRNAFIFCNRKRDVSILHRSLKKHGFDCAQLHGDMAQSERTATLAAFKAGEIRLMVCSDVAARGIDIADVSHVFNFDVPLHAEDYVHRIGRTGRAGRDGVAWTIATEEDAKLVASIEKLTGKEIPRVAIEGADPAVLLPEVRNESNPRRQQEDMRSGNARGERRPRDNRRHEGRGRDKTHPAYEVAEMTFSDNAVAFGGITPAFLLAPLTRTEENALRVASGLTPLPAPFPPEEREEKSDRNVDPSTGMTELAEEQKPFAEHKEEIITPEAERPVSTRRTRKRPSRKRGASAFAEPEGTSHEDMRSESAAEPSEVNEAPKKDSVPRRKARRRSTPASDEANQVQHSAAVDEGNETTLETPKKSTRRRSPSSAEAQETSEETAPTKKLAKRRTPARIAKKAKEKPE